MKKITSLLISLTLSTLAISVFANLPSSTLAQIRRSDSQASSPEGDRSSEQEIQNPEGVQPQKPTPEQEETLEQEEQKLDRTLDIQENNPETPKAEDVPAPGVGDNVSTPPPVGEIEIKFP